jgi:hypothetical protein
MMVSEREKNGDMRLDPSRVRRVLSLFGSSGHDFILCTTLEGLGVELGNMAASIQSVPGLNKAIAEKMEKAKSLSGSISYVSRRFTELIMRLQEIEWKNETLTYDPTRIGFNVIEDPTAKHWCMFMALAIKDFHVDIGSLMDALAPVVIQTAGELKSKDRTKLPGWADIQCGTQRSYRGTLPANLIGVVDDADDWWTVVKKVRNLLTHQDHEKIISGHPSDGILFQVYDREMTAKIVLPALTYQAQGRVVDFGLYSALVLSELVILLDDLGRIVGPMVGIDADRAATMCLREIPVAVYRSVERLAALLAGMVEKCE